MIEGYPFSLYIEQTEGFPIVPDDYEWSFDGTSISEGGSNPNISVYPVIIFTNVNRTDSGNYTVTVYNEGGTSTGFFILNVLCESCQPILIQSTVKNSLVYLYIYLLDFLGQEIICTLWY